MITRLISLLPALALALLAQPACAQYLYKSTMPDGKVIYGDAPMKGAVKVEKTKPDTSKKGISAATPSETAALKRMEAERGAGAGPGSGQDRAAELDAALRKMQAAREAAKEPQEGERTGTASGGSRFTDAYWERQKKYDQGVEMLQKELDKARSGK